MSDSPFLTAVRDSMRLRGYSLRTEQTYLHWIKFYILFNQKRHPEMMGQAEITAFLTYLAVERHVAVNTQKVALNALVYLYQKFLRIELGDLAFSLATKQRHLPIVLTMTEVAQILSKLRGATLAVVQMLYGSGLRVTECLRLRVQDIDLEPLSVSFSPLRLLRLAKISPLARYFLLLCQKKVSKENATRFRSKSR